VWLNYVRRTLGSEKQVVEEVGVHGKRKPFGMQEQVECEIQSLVDRGAQLLFVYSGGVAAYYNYSGQFFDMFPRLKTQNRITTKYYPNADHTYTLREDRDRLLNSVIAWYSSREWTR
jgi:hypothetical protein